MKLDPDYAEVKRFTNADEGDAWLVTYADMITLILCFFIILVAVSTIDPFAIQRISESFKRARGENSDQVNKYSMDVLESTLESALYKTSIEGQIEIQRDKRGLVAKISDASFYTSESKPMFQSGKANLTPHGRVLLSNLVTDVIDFPFQIAIEGHTDDTPINTSEFPSNWELSAARANNVLHFMEQQGINKKNLRIIAFGDTRPLPAFPNRTFSGEALPQNQGRNRRIEIIFINERALELNR